MKALSRRERIEVLLDHWPDFFDVASRDDVGSGVGGVYLLSGMSRHPSVVELARALSELRLFAPRKYAHLVGFYGAPFRTTRQGKLTTDKHGRRHRLKGNPRDPSVERGGWEYSRERVVPSWVRLQKVRDAVALVAQDSACPSRPWCFRGDPFLPAPLLESVLGPKVAA